MDYDADIVLSAEHNTRIMVLTNDENPSSYAVHKDSILFISKALDIDSICSIIDFNVSFMPSRKDIESDVIALISDNVRLGWF